jgi:RNA-binding protein 23/39
MLSRLYVGSLHFNLTESDIRQVFEPFGDLEFVDLHRDPMTGRSKGYAFIQSVATCSILLLKFTVYSCVGIREVKMQRWLWNKWKALSLLEGRWVLKLICLHDFLTILCQLRVNTVHEKGSVKYTQQDSLDEAGGKPFDQAVLNFQLIFVSKAVI